MTFEDFKHKHKYAIPVREPEELEVPISVTFNADQRLLYQKGAPTIYLIRHGEKPPKDTHGDDVNGLSAEGLRRAEGLVKLFGKNTRYRIGYIIAQQYKHDGSRKRPYDTVFPLSLNLGLQVDTSLDRDDAKGVAKAAKEWQGEGNVLICWEHDALQDIVKRLGVAGKVSYPDNRFDVIWIVRAPYENFHSWTSQGIEGLDEEHREP